MKTITINRVPSGNPPIGIKHSPAPGASVELRTSRFPLGLHMILVPLDGPPCSKKALACALALANQLKASLLILHVVELFPVDYCLGVQSAMEANRWQSEQAQAWLGQLRRQCASPSSASMEIMVTYGRPFREIARVARERNVDLIILSTHGYTGLKHLRLGSTAEKVVRHAPCPVLVVREQENELVVFDEIMAGKCA